MTIDRQFDTTNYDVDNNDDWQNDDNCDHDDDGNVKDNYFFEIF